MKKEKKNASCADGTVSYRRHLGHLTPAECSTRGLPVSKPGFITQCTAWRPPWGCVSGSIDLSAWQEGGSEAAVLELWL